MNWDSIIAGGLGGSLAALLQFGWRLMRSWLERRTARKDAHCPRCKQASRAGLICWRCSQEGPGVTAKLDGVEQGDTIRDKEAEKILFRAKMKELNRGKAG